MKYYIGVDIGGTNIAIGVANIITLLQPEVV